jgi:hypothetical protein
LLSSQKELREAAIVRIPRKLTETEREQLQQMLKQAPVGTAHITSMLGDAESLAFANELEQLLSKTGWLTREVTQSAFTGSPTELVLTVSSKAKRSPAINALLNIFKSIGLPSSVKVDEKELSQSLNLTIGHQPEWRALPLRKGLYL